MKPQNILLDETLQVVKIGDFGISTVLSTKTKATTLVGTPNYLGPEVCEGRPYNQKSDIWSLGCVLFEMTALRRAFDGSNLGAIVHQIQQAKLRQPIPAEYPDYLKKLINWMLEKNPHYRPSANQIIAYPPVILTTAKVICSVGQFMTLPNRSNFSNSRRMNRDKKLSSFDSENPQSTGCFVISTDESIQLPTKMGQKVSQIAIGKDMIAGIVGGSAKPIIWEEKDRLQVDNVQFSIKQLHLDVNLAVVKVFCGSNFAVALSDRGLVLATGSGSYGCLGHGSFVDVSESWRIVDHLLGSRIIDIACGSRHVIAVADNGDAFGWGESAGGRLGQIEANAETDGTTMLAVPIKIAHGWNVVRAFAGNDCSCLLTSTGSSLICSGSNRGNRLLFGKKRSTVSKFEEVELKLSTCEIKKVCFGLKHAILLDTNGNVYGWGENQRLQLGSDLPSKVTTEEPTLLNTGKVVKDITCGDFTSTLLLEGRLKKHSYGS